MPMEPNIVVLGAFLGVCKLHSFTNFGDYIVRHLQNLAPGDGRHVLLSNIFANENQWDKVAKMKKLMKQRGSEKKTPGCNSIEVNSVVHEIVVDDKLYLNWRSLFDY
ncbi:Pentatricopeptide repeat-containing protein [Thalictrum thalictroides]|uniref:Pentatricopeptide repeat-containing protein n=1 Tax=Thalictrum thalictroides TaxID=46969 RepID=A0A7J6WBD4_THATH|nr:Pentatricopeptide repeat-containing protein [Thalictrum thalictroides]